mgnify:FL=1
MWYENKDGELFSVFICGPLFGNKSDILRIKMDA